MKSFRRMLLIFNPKAGTQKFSGYLFEVVDRFCAAGYLVTAYSTQSAGEAGELIRKIGDEYDCLICSGGDGTIREAVDALMSLAKRPSFGIIPAGTVNDFAASLGIPKDVLMATESIISSDSYALDVGRFRDKHFTYVAAFGMYTDVPYSTPQQAKNMLGRLAYFLEGVKRAGTPEPLRCEFDLDGERLGGDFILGIVSNAHSVAGVRLSQEMGARTDDGLFEVILARAPQNLLEWQQIISSLLAQEAKTDLLIIRKAKRVGFSSEKPVAWTLDGDFGGEHTQAVIENRRHAIEVIRPKGG